MAGVQYQNLVSSEAAQCSLWYCSNKRPISQTIESVMKIKIKQTKEERFHWFMSNRKESYFPHELIHLVWDVFLLKWNIVTFTQKVSLQENQNSLSGPSSES